MTRSYSSTVNSATFISENNEWQFGFASNGQHTRHSGTRERITHRGVRVYACDQWNYRHLNRHRRSRSCAIVPSLCGIGFVLPQSIVPSPQAVDNDGLAFKRGFQSLTEEDTEHRTT